MLAHRRAAGSAQTKAEVDAALTAAHAKYKGLKEGKNADYIPALAKVPSKLFGIALVTVDGQVYTVGDVEQLFSIQSISKVFTMATVMQESGEKVVEDGVGVDATGQVFNSIVAVEKYKGHEMNAFVNPGAIAMTSMVKGATADAVWAKIIGTYSDFAGRPLEVNQEVYKSESDTNQRNQAIGMLMFAYGLIKENPAQATDLYTRQCSVNVNAKDLAIMAATLANGGTNPVTKKKVIDPQHVPGILAVMATAGLYDDSGKWLFHTGTPGEERRRRRHHRRVARQVRHRGVLAAARRGGQQRARAEGDHRRLERARWQSVRGEAALSGRRHPRGRGR